MQRLTWWLHTCPGPFWRSSWRVWAERLVSPTRSSNSLPGSWFSCTRSPEGIKNTGCNFFALQSDCVQDKPVPSRSAKTRTYFGNLVKLAKQLVQHNHEFFWRTITGQSSEANDVGVKNTERQESRTIYSHPALGFSSFYIFTMNAKIIDPIDWR